MDHDHHHHHAASGIPAATEMAKDRLCGCDASYYEGHEDGRGAGERANPKDNVDDQ
jgi:hypothetical protein